MSKKQVLINTLIILLGSVAALGPLTIDMYLPGFSSIANDFNTDEKQVAYTLTSYFFGISIGQLIYGPLLDRFGRKKPLLIGLSIYVITSIGISFSSSLDTLIALRFIQALGASVGMVASPAIISDLFNTKQSAKMFSSIILVMGVAPIIAPTLGGFFITHYTWRSIFLFLAIVGIITIINLHYFLRAGKEPDKSVELKLVPIFKGYAKTLSNLKFSFYSIASSLTMAIMFAYISSISLILMSIYKVSEAHFAILFGLNAFGFIAGSQVNRVLLKKFNIYRLTIIISIFTFIASILFLAAAYFTNLPLIVFSVFTFLILFSIGFTSPNTTALSFSRVKENMGLASAMSGSMRMVTGAIISGIMGLIYNDTVMPMILIFSVLSALALILQFWAKRIKP